MTAVMYREIGTVIRERGYRILDGRVSIDSLRKLRLLSVAGWKEAPRRLRMALNNCFRIRPHTSVLTRFSSIFGEAMNHQARYIAVLGISLSSILAAA